MPYVYKDARKLVGQPKVGDSECVTLVRHFTKAPSASTWQEGAPVLGNISIPEGTAIANFENGRWPGKARGNHAAFYLGQVSNGIYVVDQWLTNGSPNIRKHFIPARGKKPDGSYVTPSDNADAFSVIR
jgi:hypothetical protein